MFQTGFMNGYTAWEKTLKWAKNRMKKRRETSRKKLNDNTLPFTYSKPRLAAPGLLACPLHANFGSNY